MKESMHFQLNPVDQGEASSNTAVVFLLEKVKRALEYHPRAALDSRVTRAVVPLPLAILCVGARYS